MAFSRAHALTSVAMMLGCSFDSGGGSGGASAEIGESADDVADDDGSSGADDGGVTGGANDSTSASSNDVTSDSADGTTVDTPGGESTTTPGGELALLVFTEAPLYDFTLVALSTEERHVVTLTNTGGQAATAIVPTAPDEPFGLAGTDWPGTAGNCGEALEPGASCLVDLTFTPGRLGPAAGTLTLDYDDGEAQRQVELGLAGAGSGTIQLLDNGDAEASGDPPPSWIELSGTGWYVTNAMFHGGAQSITAGYEPNGEVVLAQPLDVSGFAGLIDAGGLSVTFSGWTRSAGDANDPSFFRVDFDDGLGANIDAFQGTEQASATWVQSTDARAVPIGTRTIAVRLHCSKGGGSTCDAFFDDMSLAVSYP